MSDTRFIKLKRRLLKFLRTLLFAYMLGISNIVNDESRYVEDWKTKIEYRVEINDDDQLRDPD